MALLKTTPAFIEVNGDRLDSSAPFVYTDSAFSKYLLTLYRERNTNVSRVMEAARNELSLALTDILNNLSALDHIPATYKPILRAHITLITSKESVVKTADIYYAGNVFNDADAYTLSLTNWNTITSNLIVPITDDVNDLEQADLDAREADRIFRLLFLFEHLKQGQRVRNRRTQGRW